jgi:hypothetical protein
VSCTSTRSGVLDAAGAELAAPPEVFGAELLADAITAAPPKSTVPTEGSDAEPYAWGAQHEARALRLGQGADDAGRVAAYIARYATKSTADAGGVSSRITKERELDDLPCREHARRLISGAWRLGKQPELDGKRLRRWAHQFGFGGHCFTKSRRFSTTFKALREARALYAASRAARADEAAEKSDHNSIHISAWRYAGRGYPRVGDALLATSIHARAREHRRLAREATVDEAGRAIHGHGEAS